jgi:hypothetical protein
MEAMSETRREGLLKDHPVLWLCISIAVIVILINFGGSPETQQVNDPSSTLFQQSHIGALDSVIQRCGEVPPTSIVDVKSTGVAILDVSGEGNADILLTSGSTAARFLAGLPGYSPQLLRQRRNQDGTFDLQAVEGAANIPALPWTCGIAAADLDADGDDDLLLTGIGHSMLLENRNGKFVEVSDSGIQTEGWCTSAAFGDLDLDGDLDLYICRYLEYDFENPPVHGDTRSCLWENQPVICGPRGLTPQHDLVFENIDGLHFREVTKQWGFQDATDGYGLAVVIIDLFGDPHPEIFVANDSCPNHLWSRSKSMQWREDGLLAGIAVDQDGQEQAGMGVGVGDLDADGRLDLVVTNFERESLNLYLNNGDGTFTDEATTRGLAAGSRPMLSWGVGVVDLDLDGLADIFVSNGHVYPEADRVASSPGYRQRDQLWLAQEVDGHVRFERPPGGDLQMSAHLGRSAALADLDRDGDIDILSTTLNGSPHLLLNSAAERASSIRIQLSQPGLNREAIGAQVGVRFDGKWIPSPVLRQDSFQSSSEAAVNLATDQIDGTGPIALEVRWPDGERETFHTDRSGSFILERGAGTRR